MKRKFTFLFTFLSLNLALNAQDGNFDLTFNNGGSGIGNGTNSATINETLLRPDGKLLVVGRISSYNGTPTRGILRLNSDGNKIGLHNLINIVERKKI
jgi:hypothetical protein